MARSRPLCEQRTGAPVTPAPGALDWDAETYDRVSDLQLSWGLEVLERLSPRADERVLDAGCGSGRVTRALIGRVPRGRVVAVDSSPAMVEKARTSLGADADVLQCDLREITLDEPVDAVFSNAVFHWIPDHPRLFGRLYDCLRPGGRLAAQCGGKGNIAKLRRALTAVAAEQPFSAYLAAGLAPPAATRGASRALRRPCPRADGRPPDARLRAPQHLGETRGRHESPWAMRTTRRLSRQGPVAEGGPRDLLR